jgi:hypothetical protein
VLSSSLAVNNFGGDGAPKRNEFLSMRSLNLTWNILRVATQAMSRLPRRTNPNIPTDGASACAQIVERVAVYRRADVQYRDLIASGLAGSVKSDFDWLRFNRRGFGVSEL